MNTLSKNITGSFGVTEDQYKAIEQAWRDSLKNKVELTSAHHLIYAAVRGKDWTNGLSPVTNKVKLANGGFYQWALWQALYPVSRYHAVQNAIEVNKSDSRYLQQVQYDFKKYADNLLQPFNGTITFEMFQSVAALITYPAKIQTDFLEWRRTYTKTRLWFGAFIDTATETQAYAAVS